MIAHYNFTTSHNYVIHDALFMTYNYTLERHIVKPGINAQLFGVILCFMFRLKNKGH